MTIAQAILLGALQGATEFLPISSSGHLVIFPALLGWREPSVAFDVLLHVGTLTAVLLYFRGDLISLGAGTLKEIRARKIGADARLLLLLLVATIPAGVAGLLLKDLFEGLFSRPVAAGGFLLVTAAVMLLADRFGTGAFGVDQLRAPGAALIGLAQAVAIAPGISRSGSTISAGMLLGMERRAAARFSFLLLIPITVGSALLKLKDLSVGEVAPGPVLAGFAAATVVGYGCIAFLLEYLGSHRLRAFAAYCAAAGAFTIGFFLLKS